AYCQSANKFSRANLLKKKRGSVALSLGNRDASAQSGGGHDWSSYISHGEYLKVLAKRLCWLRADRLLGNGATPRTVLRSEHSDNRNIGSGPDPARLWQNTVRGFQVLVNRAV